MTSLACLCHVMSCCVVLVYVDMFCYVMLCYVIYVTCMLCSAALWSGVVLQLDRNLHLELIVAPKKRSVSNETFLINRLKEKDDVIGSWEVMLVLCVDC